MYRRREHKLVVRMLVNILRSTLNCAIAQSLVGDIGDFWFGKYHYIGMKPYIWYQVTVHKSADLSCMCGRMTVCRVCEIFVFHSVQNVS